MSQSVAVLFATCCLLLLLAAAPAVGASRIELQHTGRYDGILLAISDDVAEDWSLVDKIKRSFSAASNLLPVATAGVNGRRQFAFGTVHILLPKSWNSSRVDASATWETPDVADFRVGRQGSTIPHTVQPKGCGKPGLFVKLHASHIADTQAELLGKQLVHEFAHLRWGVMDEFNSAAGPHAYLSGKRLQPVACARSLNGKFGHKDTGNPCRIDRKTLQLEPDCRFVPNDAQTATASLMYATYISSVEQFCNNDSSNSNIDHNSEAPNPQNRLCGGVSVQQVMRWHRDFRGDYNVSETDTKVNFVVLQPRAARRLVMVMDKSGSMQGRPMQKLKIAARSLVLTHLEDGIECGMLSFDQRVQRLKSISVLNSTTVRRQYWQAIKGLNAIGGTAIGGALVTAMEDLGANLARLSKNDTGYIVLLTDGDERNKYRYTFAEAIAFVKQTSIIVDTVAFGNKADKRLADLSRDTGGKSYFVSFTSGANDLLEAMGDMVRDRVSVGQKPIDVFSSPVTAGFTQQVAIDASVTQGALVMLSSPEANGISRSELQLRSPSGRLYGRMNASLYEKDAENGVISVSIGDNAEVGTWNISDSVSSTGRRLRRSAEPITSQLSLVVSSKPSSATPIILDGSISDEKVALKADTQIAVFATLASGSQLLLGANVTASVESDDGVDAVMQLRDDGAGADAQKDDGVYTGLVPSSVRVRQEYNVRLLSHSPVSRVSTAGKFEIESVDEGSLRLVPPSKVEDLRAEIDLEASRLLLMWTAVGDKRMEGTPSHYLVSACESQQDLRTSGRSCQQSNATVAAAAAGSPQQVLLTSSELGKPEATIFVGIVAVGTSGVSAHMSNAVSAQFSLPENLSEIESGGAGVGLSTVAIVLIAVGCLLAVALLAGGVFFICMRSRGKTV